MFGQRKGIDHAHSDYQSSDAERFSLSVCRPAVLPLARDVAALESAHRGDSPPSAGIRPLGVRAAVARRWLGYLVGLALGCWAVTAQATPLGTTAAQINYAWAPAFYDNLRQMHLTRGDNEVLKVFWQMSAKQLYDTETMWAANAPAHHLPATLFALAYDPSVMGYAARTQLIRRLTGVNVKYNSMTAVPAGRRVSMKLPGPPEVGGFPSEWTVMQVYTYYRSLGYVVGWSAFYAARALAPQASVWFGAGYTAGTYLDDWIATNDPDLQNAIGYCVAQGVAGANLAALEEANVMAQIQLTETLVEAGLNLVDFDGIQLGSTTTSDLLPF